MIGLVVERNAMRGRSVLHHYREWAESKEGPSLEVRRLLGRVLALYRSNRHS